MLAHGGSGNPVGEVTANFEIGVSRASRSLEERLEERGGVGPPVGSDSRGRGNPVLGCSENY